KLRKYLTLMIEESLLDIPWSFDIPALAKKNQTPVPPLTQVIKILKEMGYLCSRTHYSGTTLKTNATEPELNSIITSLKSRNSLT
ncbi:MAG: tRNA (guanine(10)-N(2))-dimethyltransferase, partial [Promethearchaeota archaeon]